MMNNRLLFAKKKIHAFILTKIRLFKKILQFKKAQKMMEINNKIFNSTLNPSQTINLTFSLNYESIKFTSGNFCIIKSPNFENEYLLNFRCINYFFSNSKNNTIISINKIIRVTKNYEIIDENKILIPDLLKKDMLHTKYNSNDKIIGIEDMKIFNFKDKIKIIGSQMNNLSNLGMVWGDYNYETNQIENLNHIQNTFNFQSVEKNWIYFVDNDELKVIYKWFPLQICRITDSNKLILEKELRMPPYFIGIRGSTCGFKYNDEIWFITHFHNINFKGRYYHNFVVFDSQMNLKKFSKHFRFEGDTIEFCLGFIISDDKFIISYSTNDTISKLGIYNKSTIDNLQWKTFF